MKHNKQICCSSVWDRVPPLSANYPWFVAQNLEAEDETEEVQIFYTLHDPSSHYRCQIPELIGKRIRGTFHGWVILSKHPDNVMWSLWNPSTSKFIRLPPLILKDGGDPNDIEDCCLSSPVDDPKSLLLLTISGKPNIVFCRLDRKRKKVRWTEMTYAKQLRNLTGGNGWLYCLTCCNGKLYALNIERCDHPVIQVDTLVKDKEVVVNLSTFMGLPSPYLNGCDFPIPFLKGTCTELFNIIIGFQDRTMKTIRAVYLFKLDMTSMMWEEMSDLKDSIFTVGLDCDLSVFHHAAIAPELDGYIHFVAEKGKIVYSYHVKDKTISLSTMPCLVGTSHMSALTMLECRLEGDHAESKEEEDKVNEIAVRSVMDDDIRHNSTTDEGDHAESKEEKDRVSEIEVRSVMDDDVEPNITADESHLLNIPFHVLEMIMEFCVGIEYLKFRATCKRCHLAAPLKQWSNKKRLQTYSLVSPWLMVFDKHQGIITFTDPIFGDKYFLKTPRKLICDFQIHCSKFGWLLIRIFDGPMVFFNPFTSDILELPDAPYYESYCFSAPPSSPDCMVVGFKACGESHVCIHFVAREPSWSRLSLDFGVVDPYSFHFPTFHGRDLYALCNKGELDVFKDMGEEDYSWESVVKEAPCTSLRQHFLVKCDQHFLLVIMGEVGEPIDVFRCNDYEEKWEKVDGLGRHMIYISDTTCLCIEAKTPKIENKIFFPRLHSKNGNIVLYSLDTNSYHTFNGENIEENFRGSFGTKQHLHPYAWIEPNSVADPIPNTTMFTKYLVRPDALFS